MSASRSFDALVAASRLPRLEARALLEHASGRAREWLIAHGDEAAPAEVADRFRTLASRRAAGEPLAYLIGAREFFGRGFTVSDSVLIPRPETELLAQWAIDVTPAGGRLLDLGTGSGAIAVTVALERPDLAVTATDASPGALEVTRVNAVRLGARGITLLQGDWYGALATQDRFDVIVANPPYLAADDPHLGQGDLRFEPAGALTDGEDGLAALRRIVDGAGARLAPRGRLGVEHGWTQGPAVRALFTRAGFEAVETLRDYENRERATVGQRP